jgi:CO/xanthine dehydrogenase Mo-binding subunit
MGQGSDTAMTQMVGEVLNIPHEACRWCRATDVTPYDMEHAARSLFHMGHAVKLAAEDARAKIRRWRRASASPRAATFRSRRCSEEIHGMQAGNIVGTGIYKPTYVPSDP